MIAEVLLGSGFLLALVGLFYWRKKYWHFHNIFRYENWEDYLLEPYAGIVLSKEEKKVSSYILQKVTNKYSSEALNKQMEYSVLQSQINPHFLYNTLDSIRGEALVEGNENIAVMTEKLSRFFRYCITTRGDFVTLRDEINNVLDYFYIQQYRFGDKFALVIEAEEKLYDYDVPKMILQPIVENAIYHGLERQKKAGKIRLSIIETEYSIKFSVVDDGVGIEEKRLKEINDKLKKNVYQNRSENVGKKTGIALYNVNYRIKLCYGDDYGVMIRSTVGMGTDVNIIIPKQKRQMQEGQ